MKKTIMLCLMVLLSAGPVLAHCGSCGVEDIHDEAEVAAAKAHDEMHAEGEEYEMMEEGEEAMMEEEAMEEMDAEMEEAAMEEDEMATDEGMEHDHSEEVEK